MVPYDYIFFLFAFFNFLYFLRRFQVIVGRIANLLFVSDITIEKILHQAISFDIASDDGLAVNWR